MTKKGWLFELWERGALRAGRFADQLLSSFSLGRTGRRNVCARGHAKQRKNGKKRASFLVIFPLFSGRNRADAQRLLFGIRCFFFGVFGDSSAKFGHTQS